MQITATTLLDTHAIAGDDRLPVRELFFDAETWRLTHVALDAGGWLSRREVLVAMQRFDTPTAEGWPVSMTADEIKNAPVWEDAPESPTFLPSLVVGPFGYSISPMMMRAQIADDMAGDEPSASPPQDDAANATTRRVRRKERATDWIGRDAFDGGGAIGQVTDLLLGDEFALEGYVVDDTPMPRSRLQRVADQGHLIFD